MTTFRIEITDTFGGEANYSWVKRYTYDAKNFRGAIQKLARDHGAGWRQVWNTGDQARYDLTGTCVCLFIEERFED